MSDKFRIRAGAAVLIVGALFILGGAVTIWVLPSRWAEAQVLAGVTLIWMAGKILPATKL